MQVRIEWTETSSRVATIETGLTVEELRKVVDEMGLCDFLDEYVEDGGYEHDSGYLRWVTIEKVT